jgi:hypothetical protein
MSVLPWDRYTPDQPSTPPVEPPAPPVPVPSVPAAPAPPPPINGDVRDAIRSVAKEIADETLGYIRGTAAAAKAGEHVDHTNPTITAATAAGRPLVIADAKNRSWRTFWQGLAIDVTAALIAVLSTLTGLDPFTKDTWIVIAALAIKTLIQTVISYLARLRITPTIKTKEPAPAIGAPQPESGTA